MSIRDYLFDGVAPLFEFEGDTVRNVEFPSEKLITGV